MSQTEHPAFPSLYFDDAGQPVSGRFNDVYFSRESGIDESRYVFVENNHLTQHWRAQTAGKTFYLGETGFGTGLNFLVTWDHWNKYRPANSRLHFLSVEKYPLTKEQLTKALSLWPELQTLSQSLIAHYPPANIPGIHRLAFDNNQVSLTLFFGEAIEGLRQFSASPVSMNAWYLDGFAPAKNPEMWSDDLFAELAQLSRAGTTFATFTAAGAVRRGLESVGFNCVKVKGFGRKREMLIGEFKEAIHAKRGSNGNVIPRWCLSDNHPPAKSALVIGGGLAGCHTAFALANRGLNVTVLEKENRLASKASGNAQGIVYTKLSPHSGILPDFNLLAQVYANHFYAVNPFFEKCGKQCGVIHLAKDEKACEAYTKLEAKFQTDMDFAIFIPQAKTSEIAGLDLDFPGLFIRKAGWLSPIKLCQALCEHPNIQVVTDFTVEKLEYCDDNNLWHASDEHAKHVAADIAIIANAQAASHFELCRHLPLKSIRGQISHLPASPESGKLRCVICGDGYLAPAVDGVHYCGATYTLNSGNPEATIEEHRENIRNVCALSSNLNFNVTMANSVDGRAGFRCTTPDYLPIVGPAPNELRMMEEFDFLRKKANAMANTKGQYHPSLYLNLGYGSRGLAYTPLCAEMLASLVCSEPLPVLGKMYSYIHPARFIIRNLQRKKVNHN